MFTLTTSTGAVVRLPSEDDLVPAVTESLNVHESWAELSSNFSSNYFLRVEESKEGRGGFVLEYRFGKRDHYRTVPPNLTAEEVVQAFCEFLRGDTAWMLRFAHRRVRQDPAQSTGRARWPEPPTASRRSLVAPKATEVVEPSTYEVLQLASGRQVSIPKSTPVFQSWHGEAPADTYGGKAVLDYLGEPVFAEIAILRSLERRGWTGVWIDTYRKKYRIGYWGVTPVELPPERSQLLNRIYSRTGTRSGAFDVFCWLGAKVLFAESKRKGRDSIRETQLIWLEAAFKEGLLPEDFLIVEWSLA